MTLCHTKLNVGITFFTNVSTLTTANGDTAFLVPRRVESNPGPVIHILFSPSLGS